MSSVPPPPPQISPGTVVGWVHGGGPVWGRVQAIEAARLRVRLGERVLKIPLDAVVVRAAGDPAAVATESQRRARDWDAQTLWERLRARGDGAFSVEQAARAAGREDPDDVPALWLVLWEHAEFFAREGRTRFVARTPVEVEAERARRAARREEAAQLARVEAAGAFLRADPPQPERWRAEPLVGGVLQEAACGVPAAPGTAESVRQRVLHQLEQLHADLQSRWPIEYTAAQALGLDDPWRAGHPQLAAHQRWLAATLPPPAEAPAAGVGDLPDLATELWAVDDAGTDDRDDAVGAVPDGPDAVRLEIAMADVVSGFGRRDDWFARLAGLGTSVYLPTGTVPLLPPAWGSRRHSLDAGETRAVFLISVRVSTVDGRLLDRPELRRGRVRIAGVASYADLDAGRVRVPGWDSVVRAAAALEQARMQRGAERIEQPEARVLVRGGLPVNLVCARPWEGARAVIRECMILANSVAGKRLADAGIPAPFRTQDAAAADRIMTQVRVRPEPHAGIGAEAYVYVTSPIRRFVDVLAQRQLAALFGEPALDREQLAEWVERSERAQADMRRWMAAADRYWKLRWLEAHPDQPLQAEVERSHTDAVRVRLVPLEIRATLSPPPRARGSGPVRLRSVDAETGRLELDWLGDGPV